MTGLHGKINIKMSIGFLPPALSVCVLYGDSYTGLGSVLTEMFSGCSSDVWQLCWEHAGHWPLLSGEAIQHCGVFTSCFLRVFFVTSRKRKTLPCKKLFESCWNRNGFTVLKSYHCSIITEREYIIHERFSLINLWNILKVQSFYFSRDLWVLQIFSETWICSLMRSRIPWLSLWNTARWQHFPSAFHESLSVQMFALNLSFFPLLSFSCTLTSIRGTAWWSIPSPGTGLAPFSQLTKPQGTSMP